MSAPLIPYIDLPVQFPSQPIEVLGLSLSIKIFGILVAIGVYVGVIVSLRRAKQRFIDTKRMTDFIFWVVATGFVLSHVLDAIFYHPDAIAENPVYLLKIWDGLSSYGGLIGAVIGAFMWRALRKRPILEYVDVCVSAFPLAWVFGRLGCATVHDHPGALTTSFIGVKFPVGKGGEVIDGVYHGRFDLGLYEMVLTIPLALACWYLWRKKPFRAPGFYVGLTTAYYAPIRFGLDFLRVGPHEMSGSGDPRYFGLTPAQWVCFVALALGIYMMRRTLTPAAVTAAERVGVERAEEAKRVAQGAELGGEETSVVATAAPAMAGGPSGDAELVSVRERARERRQAKRGKGKRKAGAASGSTPKAATEAPERQEAPAAAGGGADAPDELATPEPGRKQDEGSPDTAPDETGGDDALPRDTKKAASKDKPRAPERDEGDDGDA